MDAIAYGLVRQSSHISGLGLITLFSLVGLVVSALLVRLGVDLSAVFASCALLG
jgi:hypothetical protein